MKNFKNLLIITAFAGSCFGQASKLASRSCRRQSRRRRGRHREVQIDSRETQHQKIVGNGGVYKFTHRIIQAASYRVHGHQLADLANDPDVEFVSLDHPISSLGILTGAKGRQRRLRRSARDFPTARWEL